MHGPGDARLCPAMPTAHPTNGDSRFRGNDTVGGNGLVFPASPLPELNRIRATVLFPPTGVIPAKAGTQVAGSVAARGGGSRSRRARRDSPHPGLLGLAALAKRAALPTRWRESVLTVRVVFPPTQPKSLNSNNLLRKSAKNLSPSLWRPHNPPALTVNAVH